MEQRKLLIADSTLEFSKALQAALQDEFCIRVAEDGKVAMALLDSFCPDVLVVDVVLPGVDGIRVLESARNRDCKLSVLVTTAVCSEYIFAKLTDLKVNYVLMKPCNLEITAERVREIAEEHNLPATQNEEQKLTAILLQLGVNPKHNGFHYLCAAVKAYMEDKKQALTKELYVTVGSTFGASWQQVERSIRAALESAWKHRDEKIWDQWFPAGTLSAIKRPTNGEVICQLAEHLLLDQNRKVG
jgi:DNA-binding response OmpR family regulator